jgi:hypothetical protein
MYMKECTAPNIKIALNYAKKIGIVQEAVDLGVSFLQSDSSTEDFTRAVQIARGERLPDSHSYTNVPNEMWDLIIDHLEDWVDIDNLRMTCRKLSTIVAARNDIKRLRFLERGAGCYISYGQTKFCDKEDAMQFFGLDRNDINLLTPAAWSESGPKGVQVYNPRQIAARLAHKHHGSFELYKQHMAALRKAHRN